MSDDAEDTVAEVLPVEFLPLTGLPQKAPQQSLRAKKSSSLLSLDLPVQNSDVTH